MIKLTDLDIDCLECVFEYLELGDLLNVTDSNKRLRNAANFVVDRKYSNTYFIFQNIHLSQNRSVEIKKNPKDFPQLKYCITVRDLKTSLQFLRCFGYLKAYMEFDLSLPKPSELDQHLINYCNEYCSNTDMAIKIVNGLEAWEHLEKPFTNIETVYMVGCHITDARSINKLFPKMRSMTCDFAGINCKSFYVNTNYFPNLKKLIIIDPENGSLELVGKITSQILHLNTQIESLDIYTLHLILDSNHFRNAIANLQNIQTLALGVKSLYTSPINAITSLKNVQTFEIYIDGNIIMDIPFLFDQLTTLVLHFSSVLYPVFFNFINKHSTIKNLTLSVDSLSTTDLSELAESLPSLVSIILKDCNVAANESIKFISNFKNLNQFSFFLNDMTAFGDFQDQLNNEWKCSLNQLGMICMNRKKIRPFEATGSLMDRQKIK